MEIRQNDIEFHPITIELKTAEEAQAFLNIVDMAEGNLFALDSLENKLLVYISNAVTNGIVFIP